MMHIGVIEGADDLEDRVYISDMSEKFVPESFSLGCSFDEACDIDKFDGCRDDLGAIYDDTDFLEPFIVHIHDASIRLDCTEGEVRGFGGI